MVQEASPGRNVNVVKVYIKNLVCGRCKLIVKNELEKLDIRPQSITEGEIEIDEELSPDRFRQIQDAFAELDLELINDRDSILIDKITNILTDLVYSVHEPTHINLSEYLPSKLGYSYSHLSHLFSSVHGTSIEKAYIKKKIERVKEVLLHEKLSFNEIAFKVNYCSIAHLSSQFKKETGLTLTQFKALNQT